MEVRIWVSLSIGVVLETRVPLFVVKLETIFGNSDELKPVDLTVEKGLMVRVNQEAPV